VSSTAGAIQAVMHSSALLYLYRVSNQGEKRVIPQVKATKLQEVPFPDLMRQRRNVRPCVGLQGAHRNKGQARGSKT
jgi:hypothetical protein